MLAPFTTFKIGGPARYFIEVVTKDELLDAIRWAKRKEVSFFILGGGSNILVNDKGYNGLVIKNNCRSINLEGDLLTAESGALMAQVVALAVKEEKAGLEWATGLPGTVGGAVRGNAGCFGSGMHDCIESVEYLDLKTSKIQRLSNSKCGFSYHHSVFSNNNNVIISADFKLAPGDKNKMQTEIKDIIEFRGARQVKQASPGSIFKNFTFAEMKKANGELLLEAQKLNKVRDGGVGAGWLIEMLDLKGKTIGGAQISPIHANFIVNLTGDATSSDVIMLISYIKQQVRDNFKVQLKEEVQYVGF